MLDNYWHIELYSGEIIKVKPDAEVIAHIQKKMEQQQGAINTPTRSIVVKDIRDFRLSDEPYSDQKLLEGAAQAFNEAIDSTIIGENGKQYKAIKARLVKKSVPRRRWETYYKFIPSYKLLSEVDNYVLMAFVVPVHLINLMRVQYLTANEEMYLSTKNSTLV